MENGVVQSTDRSDWDLGFATSQVSVSIRINGGAGVELYTYPAGDTSDWAMLDTFGMTGLPCIIRWKRFRRGLS